MAFCPSDLLKAQKIRGSGIGIPKVNDSDREYFLGIAFCTNIDAGGIYLWYFTFYYTNFRFLNFKAERPKYIFGAKIQNFRSKR